MAMFLGIILGTVASSNLQYHQGEFVEVFVLTWIQPFPLAVGIWTITLFALLASIYLIHETTIPDLKELVRRRAQWAIAASGLMAIVVFLLSRHEAPDIRQGLSQHWSGGVLLSMAIWGMLASVVGLWTNRYHLARASAMGYGTAIVWGWG